MNEITVLMVISDQNEAALYASYLCDGDGQFSLLAASTTREALAICQEMTPDCILVGDCIADLNVLDFFVELSSPTGTLPCAVVTVLNQANLAIEDRILKVGAQDCLLREEVNHRSLRRTVRNAVQKSAFAEDRRRLKAALHRSDKELCNIGSDEQAVHDAREPAASIQSDRNQAPPEAATTGLASLGTGAASGRNVR